MRIVVLNGSPKGENSVTLQYVRWLEKVNAQHHYEVHHVGQMVRKLEQDTGLFDKLMTSIDTADGVIWDYPLYVMMVPAGYKRFIELIYERDMTHVFKGKPTFQLATSINFYDHTAVGYMEDVISDLKMTYAGAYSAEMRDLLDANERQRLRTFNDYFVHLMEKDALPTGRSLKVAIIHDDTDNTLSGSLSKLIDDFCEQMELNLGSRDRIDTFKLSEMEIKGSCLGCLKCGKSNRCVYEGKDKVIDTYKVIGGYDIIVHAVHVVDHYFSSQWKAFVDRRFFNTHQPLLNGKQLIYLIAGDLNREGNLLHIIKANAELDECQLAGIVTSHDNEGMSMVVSRAIWFAGNRYVAPRTFLGKGGVKLFRDAIWGRLRFVFMSDHRYYRSHGYYDFPQKEWRVRLLNLFAPIIRGIPRVNDDIEKNMIRYMLMPYKKFVDNATAKD